MPLNDASTRGPASAGAGTGCDVAVDVEADTDAELVADKADVGFSLTAGFSGTVGPGVDVAVVAADVIDASGVGVGVGVKTWDGDGAGAGAEARAGLVDAAALRDTEVSGAGVVDGFTSCN